MTTSAGGGLGVTESFKAASDLSSNQFRFVRVTAANTIGSTNISGTTPCVILQDKPDAAGVPGACITSGVSKLLMGGSCTAGDRLIAGTDGRGLISDSGTTDYCNALADEAASAAGDIITVRTASYINTSGAAS